MDMFSELGSDINYVINLLLGSQNLLKLLYYQSSTPLSQPDITTPKSLIMTNIFPFPKIPKVEQEEISVVDILFTGGKPNGNIGFKNSKLIFYIICHINTWLVSGTISTLRPYEIANEINSIFENRRNSQLTLGQVLFDSWDYVVWNNMFCGYVLSYKLVD